MYVNIFSFVVEWFAECCCRHVDECSVYNYRITYSLLNEAWIATMLKFVYIIEFILLNTYYLYY